MKKTLLVTGAAGFIGSHVAEALLRRGDSVVGLDNLCTAYAPARKQANLDAVRASACAREQWTFVQGDIRDRPLLDRLFGENAFDAVIHLAAQPGGAISIEDPPLSADIHLNGTLQLLGAAKETLVGNFVFASAAGVYGDTPAVPCEESAPCDRPLTPYAATKRAAEMLGFSFHHLYSLNFTALRFFSVYGPRCRPDSLAFQIADGIRNGKKVRLHRKGQIHRDWIAVDDLVAGIVMAADRPLGYEILNLGRGEPVLAADFVALLERHSGGRAHLIPALPPDFDSPCVFADIGKARRLLDFAPRVSLEEGVARFWEWYRSEPSAAL
ncbi:MAG: NAD-dependent epimerase/dehydratase family protein [Chthoniobacteraceae bacterium]|nr:NAD-dependent epimerase/dehydratase family protein [Chthoniobacteraceae bacterium]